MIDNKRYIVKLFWFIFHISLFIMILNNTLNNTYLQSFLGVPMGDYQKITQIICLVLLLVALMINYRIKKSQLLIIFVIFFLLIKVYFSIKDINILNNIFFVLAFSRLEYKKVARVIYIFEAFCLVLVLSLCAIGILENVTFVRLGVERHSLGFVHPNTLATMVLKIMIPYIYYKYDKFKNRNFIAWVIIAIVVYLITNSRICINIMLLLLVSIIYLKINNKAFTSSISKAFYIWIVPGLSIICISLGKIYSEDYGNVLLTYLDGLFQGRIYYMSYFYKNYELSLFGQSIETVSLKDAQSGGLQWLGLDNSYMMMFVKYGIVFLGIFCLVYIFIGKQAWENNDKIMLICILAIALLGITESGIFFIANNFTLFYVSAVIYDRKKMPFANKKHMFRIRV